MGTARLSHESAKQIPGLLPWKINKTMRPAVPADTLGLTLAFRYSERILAISPDELLITNLILYELLQLL